LPFPVVLFIVTVFFIVVFLFIVTDGSWDRRGILRETTSAGISRSAGFGSTTTARRGSRATASVGSGLGSPVAGQATTRRLPACTPLPRTKNANRCAAAAGLAPVQLGGVRPGIAVRAGGSVPKVTNVDAQVADVVEGGPHVDKSVLRGGSSVTSWCPRSKDEDRLSAARLFPQPTPSSQRVAGAGQGGRRIISS